MEAVLQIEGFPRPDGRRLSLRLDRGERRLLSLESAGQMAALVDLVTGCRRDPEVSVLIGGRRAGTGTARQVGWVSARGDLLERLSGLDNILLPLAYHDRAVPADMEERLERWRLPLIPQAETWRDTLSAEAAALSPALRWRVGLLRALMARPALLLVEQALFGPLAAASRQAVERVLEDFLAEEPDRAILILGVAESEAPG